ncbi:MAG: polymer-forming cytoskeletal protein, partial [Deltaproteobacteria bacterium]|nr:polymer-forming cytoskeletal protein [Deltaproteobacteria bacterium]
MEDRRTTIGEGTLIAGDIRGEEDVVVCGRIEGRVDLSATLFIEATSLIKGELRVNHAVVMGSVLGDIHAADCIEIAQSGRVIGNLFTPRLVIADGGAVKG